MNIFRGTLRSGNFTKNRLEAYSDGVFAIVVTLLILEIRVPPIEGHPVSVELFAALKALAPKFFSYVLSFGYITIYWVNHHQLFHLMKRADRGLFWLNSLFLMCLAFIPFPTALIGEYYREYVAVIFYGVAMLATAVSFVAMKWYAVEVARLVDPGVESSILKQSLFKVVVGPLLYFLAIGLAFWNTMAAIAIYVLIPIIYFFPGKIEKG